MTDEQKDKVNFLNKAYHLDGKIKALEKLKDDNKTISAICYENTGLKNYCNENNSEIKMARISDMSMKIDEELKRLESLKNEIFDTICTLHDDELETILIYRYLHFMTLEQIADTMHYNEKTVSRKLHKAIAKMSCNVL